MKCLGSKKYVKTYNDKQRTLPIEYLTASHIKENLMLEIIKLRANDPNGT